MTYLPCYAEYQARIMYVKLTNFSNGPEWSDRARLQRKRAHGSGGNGNRERASECHVSSERDLCTVRSAAAAKRVTCKGSNEETKGRWMKMHLSRVSPYVCVQPLQPPPRPIQSTSESQRAKYAQSDYNQFYRSHCVPRNQIQRAAQTNLSCR